MEQLTQICKDALYKAHNVLYALGDRGISEVHDEHVTDISTQGDMAVSKALTRFFEEQKFPAVLYSEENVVKKMGKPNSRQTPNTPLPSMV